MQKIHVEGDPKLKNTGSKQYSMFIGRWQPWHAGHRWLIDQRLNEGKNVLICIRDIKPDEIESSKYKDVYYKNLPDKTTEFFWYGFKNSIINLIC